MRPIFALPASGPIYTGHWIRQAIPSISCSLPIEIVWQPSTSCNLLCGVWGIFGHASSMWMVTRLILRSLRNSYKRALLKDSVFSEYLHSFVDRQTSYRVSISGGRDASKQGDINCLLGGFDRGQ